MANKRGGLSKREYAAKQAGGTLNYKTGVISVPKKTTSSKISSGGSSGGGYTSPQNENEIFVNGQGFSVASDKQDAFLGQQGIQRNPVTQQYSYIDTNKMFQTPDVKTSKSSSKVDTSQRSSAADAVRKSLGINTANAQESKPSNIYTPTTSNSTGRLGSIFQSLVNPIGAVYRNVTGGHQMPDLGVSELLGLTKQTPNLTYNLGQTPETDPTTGNVINPSNPENIVNNPSPYQSWETFNQSQGNPTTNRTDTRNSRQVSQPTPIFQPAQSSNLSSIFGGSPQSAPQDFSNNTQTNDQTRRQLLGNGYFSNGIASNGAGNYGIEGAMTGTDQMNPMDELMTMLGLKPQTALAAEPNMFVQPNALQSAMSNNYISSPIYQDTMNRMYGQSNEDITSTPQNQQQNVQRGSGVAQQYAQINPATQYYQDSIKGYGKQEKDTEKAYKKALSEMLKGIESQYATSETTGVNDLNKQKVNDLQALASRFSFGLNQDPNSEQAVQYSQRTSNDYAGQLSDFLAKLAAAKTQDISQARSGNQSQLQSALSQISTQRSSAQEKLAELMYTMQNDAANRNAKGSGNSVYGRQYTYDDNGNITGTVQQDASGNIFYNPLDTPIKGKSKTDSMGWLNNLFPNQ